VFHRPTRYEHAGDPSDTRTLRSILGSFVTGVTVATTIDANGGPVGVTANSFSSVSLSPPLVSWCLKTSSHSLAAFRYTRRFAINVLGASDIELCRRFAQGNPYKWRDLAHRYGYNGCPILDEAIATIECALAAEHEAGDHVILIGQIERAAAQDPALPLVLSRGRYYDLTGTEEAATK
jgi:flavin reductase (DIM6/NTAB) family NADH-FMN oxidoreductase RutF